MKKWKAETWGTMIALVAITATAVVFLIIGITTHEEPGFIEGVPKWTPEDFPLAVRAETYGSPRLSADHRNVVRYVIDLVNSRIGEQVFVLSNSEEQTAKVKIVINAPIERAWRDLGGHSQIYHTGGRADSCEVTVGGVDTDELLALTLYHELGHCLGLAHDDFEISIMRPVQRPTASGTIPPWFTDRDRALIRQTYFQPSHVAIVPPY